MPDSRSLPPAAPSPPAAVMAIDVPGSATSALIQRIDWSATPLGPMAEWPHSLVSLLGVLLHSRHPMFLWWGPELIQFYNDAYLPSFGEGRHPAAMGQPGRECWREIWSIIGPQIAAVMQRGEASWNEDALVPIYRNGRVEEVYWTYGYSPAFDDYGRIAGTLVVCTETTARVVAARRLDLLRRLGERLAAASKSDDLLPALSECLQGARLDAPFFEHEAAPVGLDGGSTVPQVVELGEPRATDSWPEPVTRAVRLKSPSSEGYLLFGVSPRLALDAAYCDFFLQVTEQLEQASARIRAFRARAVAESERRNLIMQAPIAAAILTGPRHVFELTNPLYVRMLGREVLGKAYVEAIPERAGSELERVMDRVYETGEPFVAQEYWVPMDRDGSGALQDVYFRFNLEPVRDVNDAIYGVMVVALEITQEVSARMAVEKSASERERLLQQLEAAGHAKDEFLATVSHELRTPLTSILGWARLLNENSDAARIQKGLSAIERNAKAQAKLIEDILDVSRIVSGKLRLNLRRVDAAAAVQGAVEAVRPLASAKHQRLSLELESELPTLTADEDRLQQIVWNLLSNAVKFTPEDGAIELRVRRAEDTVVISVKDNGKGISPEFLPQVFDRFRQDDTSTTKQHAGLGLGLAIVRHLVELHGGLVMAESDGAGTGSLFSVALPLRPPAPQDIAVDAQPFSSPSENSAHGPGRLRGVRVLVLDDQDDARELLATVLEDAGAEVEQLSSVQAALDALARGNVQAVVSDIGMPDEDGYTFMRRLRSKSGEERHVPAIAVTAFARAEDRLRAFNSGFQQHISKPIDPGVLVDLVAKLVER